MLVKDTTGTPSWTLTLMLFPFVLVNIKFIVGGLTLPLVGAQPEIGVVEFAAALTTIITPFLIRSGVDAAVAAKAKAAVLASAERIEASAVRARAEVKEDRIKAKAEAEESDSDERAAEDQQAAAAVQEKAAAVQTEAASVQAKAADVHAKLKEGAGHD